jgi:hypothetical protein
MVETNSLASEEEATNFLTSGRIPAGGPYISIDGGGGRPAGIYKREKVKRLLTTTHNEWRCLWGHHQQRMHANTQMETNQLG